MEIKVVDKNDQDFLYEMLYQSIYVNPDSPKPNRDIIKAPEISKYVSDWGKEGDFAIIALDNDRNPVGAVWLRYFDKNNKGYGFIDESIPEIGIAVDEFNRGKGIGTYLLEEILKRTKNTVKSISLSVQENNPARKIYLKYGFYDFRRDLDSMIMRYDNHQL